MAYDGRAPGRTTDGGRHLHWDGCTNTRDLGGIPTMDGSTTRLGVIVRSDDISTLSPAGRQALRAHGVRTAVDLRSTEERAATGARLADVSVIAVPLFGRIDRCATARIDGILGASEGAASALRALYEDALVTHAARIGRAVTAVATSLDAGGVVVHCAAGKDRTGIVSALLLRLAGVSVAAAADDYALSGSRVRARVGQWVATAPDPVARQARERATAAPREAMVGMLRTVDARHGGAGRFLRDAGVPREALDQIGACLRRERATT